MAPYYHTSLPPPPPPPPPQYNAYFSDLWNAWGYHSPYANLPGIPPLRTPQQPPIYTGKSAQTTIVLMPDLDRHPVHQGGMSTYDESGLANWVAANSFPNHPGVTDGHLPKATAHAHQARPAVPSSKVTTHDHVLNPRHGPAATTPFGHQNTTSTTPKARSSLKKAVRFTPSVQARDDAKHEADDRTRSNGTTIRCMACERCHVKPVGWTVDGEEYCDGCCRDLKKRRYRHYMVDRPKGVEGRDGAQWLWNAGGG